MKHTLILILLPLMLCSSEKPVMDAHKLYLATLNQKSFLNDISPNSDKKYLNTIHDTFQKNNEIYIHTDSSETEIYIPHDNAYTYATPGGLEFNVGLCFGHFRMDERALYRFPHTFKVANGIVNRPNGFKNAFNWRLEAIRNIQNLQNELAHNTPVECWQTICYGFFSLSSTLFALHSSSREAVKLRETLSLSTNDTFAIVDSLKLCITSSPLLSSTRMLDEQYNPIVKKALLGASLLPLLLNNYSRDSNLLWYSLPVITFLAQNKIAPMLSYYGMKFKTAVDEKQGDGLKLIYELSKEKKTSTSTLLINWQKNDPIASTVRPDDLKIVSSFFNQVIGIGSPFENHEQDDARQIAVTNTVRKNLDLPHYNEKYLLYIGKKYFEEIMPFHIAQDWQGLKKYTEDPTKYIL
ncbi:hypothetical protein EKK58_02580 [Candidatus Dependentiae bacterium]|nr:MAG: hypothetical protein EKK58_02580 [Candidatus Dependentiae bacterium]